MTLCNKMIAEQEEKDKIKYTFKIRLRTDIAFLSPIPPLHALDLGTRAKPKIRQLSGQYLTSNYDKFGVGLSTAMDCFLDRFHAVRTYPKLAHLKGWSAENFLTWWCNDTQHAQLEQDERLQAVMVRSIGYSRTLRTGGGGHGETAQLPWDRGRGCICSLYRGPSGNCKKVRAQAAKEPWYACYILCCPCHLNNGTNEHKDDIDHLQRQTPGGSASRPAQLWRTVGGISCQQSYAKGRTKK